MRRLLAIISSSAVVLFGFAAVATAHSGDVTGSEDCNTFTVHVTLAHNVTTDRDVIVTTTIPGTTGIADGHYDSTFGEILTLSGPAPATGTVTLTIKNGSSVEFTTNASIKPVEDCPKESEPAESIPAESIPAESIPAESIPAESIPAESAPVQTVLAGTGTPAASVPNTSLDGNGSSPLPTIIFSMVLLASLGTLAYTNVKVARTPRIDR